MTLANPAGLLFLLTIPLLLLLRSVSRPRKKQVVPSLHLWGASSPPPPAWAFLRRLPVDVLLFLQIAFLAVVAVALARPEWHWWQTGIKRVTLLLDTSMSMQATDIFPSRFEAARAEALTVLNRLEPGREVMVMEAGVRPVVRQSFTAGRARTRAALERLTPQDGGGTIGEALELLRTMAKDAPLEIHLFTDGAYDRLAWSPREGQVLTTHRIGTRGRNVGIAAFRIRKSYYAHSRYELFVDVINSAPEPMTSPLVLFLGGEQIHAEEVTLPARTRRGFIIPVISRGEGVVEARLEVRDDLDVDNRAYTVIPPPSMLKVLLVSEGNRFLENALKADPQVEVTSVDPEGFPQARAGQDVVVLDLYSPSSIPPGRYLLIHSVPGNAPVEILGSVPGPRIVDWDRRHPAMRYLDLSHVLIETALKIRPLAGSHTLIESQMTPLALTFDEGEYRLVFLGFDPLKSDFPLRAAFPVFISNALRWLYPTRIEDQELQGSVGVPLRVTLDPTIEQVSLTGLDGEERPVPILGGRAYLPALRRAGVYRIRGGEWQRQIAMNVPSDELDLTPRAPLPNLGIAQGTERFEVTWELWRLLLSVALGVLCVELFLAYRREQRRLAFVAARVGGLLCLAWALLNPALPRTVDRLNVLFLWDRSDSMPVAEQTRAWEFMQQSLQWKGSGDTAGLISFNAQSRIDVPSSHDPNFSTQPEAPLGREGTELAGALRAAIATLPADGASRVVLLSDGQENRGGVLEEVVAARDMGIQIHALPLGVSEKGEVLLEQLSLPQEVKEGESFVLRLIVRSTAKSTGRITLVRNGEFLGAQTVQLAPGKNIFAYRQALRKAGFHVYQASLSAPGDVREANNRALGAVAVRGRPRVLYVERDGAQGHHLLRVLENQQFDVELVSPERVPRDLATLLRYDTVILGDVSALRLTGRQMDLIRSYVRDHGGGLIMLGGEESFGLGGYYQSPVEESLPVTMEVRQPLEVPSLAVVLVIDRSGSMDAGVGRFTKLELAKEAAQLVVELLGRRSQLGILAFDTGNAWIVPIQPVQDKERIRYEIATIKSGGGTDVFPALKEAYEHLLHREARLKHLVLLSDGQSASGDFAFLARQIARDQITVSTVAIGRDADTRLLRNISEWGRGRYYYTDDAQTLPRIFAVEAQLASKAAAVEKPFFPVVTAPLHEILQRINWRTAPPLGGYVASTVKPTAELLLASPQGDPVLAVWRYGLGRSAAFTSDAKARWGVLWLEWEGFPHLFAQLIRWTLRRGQPQALATTFDRKGDRGLVTLEAISPEGEFLNFLEASAGVIAPDTSRIVVDLAQVAPGRYEGTFPLKGEGAYLVGLLEKQGETTLHSELGNMILPNDVEHRMLGRNLPLLKEMVGVSGGRLLTKPEEAFRFGRRAAEVWTPLWPYLAVVSVLCLFAEYVSRRFPWHEAGEGFPTQRGMVVPPSRLIKGRRRR